jgi:GntR family transcriptional regulator
VYVGARRSTHLCAWVIPGIEGQPRGGKCVIVPLDFDSPVPLYEQLAELLRRDIARGRLKGRVPSIISLAQEHEVSHKTAARALTTLRDEGVIVSAAGKGYYVR